MKYLKQIAVLCAVTSLFTACKDDNMGPGNPIMDVTGDLGSTFFGDTLRFSVKATDAEVPLSTIHADLYYGSEKVSSQVIRTKVSGAEYPVAIYVPYLANIPDGEASLYLTLQNINFTTTEQLYNVSVTHRNYTHLTLVTDEGEEYVMQPDGTYQYSVTATFPQKVNGKIYTPENEYGDKVIFGYEGGVIKVDGDNSIPFSNSNPGDFTISFNTYTFEGSPFIAPTINGQSVMAMDAVNSYVDLNLAKGATLEFEGFPDFEEWWLNPDYIQANPDGTYSFMAYDGNYRFIANSKLQYFQVVKLVGNQPATLNEDGTGGVWILGDGIGYPDLNNAPGWNPGKGISMAPQSDKVYQVTVVGGTSIDVSSVNFKFFGQDGWGTELKHDMITSESPLFQIGLGDDNNDGNVTFAEGVKLAGNTIYVITLDLTGGINNAILKTQVAGESQFEEKPVYINGQKMDTFNNSSYSYVLNLNQNDNITITGNVDMSGIYADQDYFTANGGALQFNAISGYYNIVLDLEKGSLGAVATDAAGTELTLQPDGSGALWLMGWGVGSPNQDYQFGFDPGKAYCMAQVSPKVYQFTGKAGPETESLIGDRFRTDYLSFKFFWQDGWGGEFNDSSNILTMVGTSADFIKNTGNYELAGVKLIEGDTYRIIIDLTQGVDNGTIDFIKL